MKPSYRKFLGLLQRSMSSSRITLLALPFVIEHPIAYLTLLLYNAYVRITYTPPKMDKSHTVSRTYVHAAQCRKPLPSHAYLHAYTNKGMNPRPCCSYSTKSIVISSNYFHVTSDLQQRHIRFKLRPHEIIMPVYFIFILSRKMASPINININTCSLYCNYI